MAPPDSTAPDPAEQGGARRRWAVPAAIVAITAALVIGVLWLQPGGNDSGEASRETPSTTASDGGAAAIEHPSSVAVPDLSDQESRDPDDLLAEGSVDAPVTLVVFTDYQCPYCAQWSTETLPAMREYVDRGELRIEWRDVNVYGEDSERAARASLAAAMQGRHEDFHGRLFDGAEIRSPDELSEQALIDLAAELGLDPEQFAEDIDSEQVATTIEANAQQGIELGAMSTPAFILGGTPTVGAQPTEVFVDMVDQALADSEG